MIIDKMIQDWDKDIKDWSINPSNITGKMSVFSNAVAQGKLSMDYLPEPYYGDSENCSTVVVNINPGSSSKFEDTKNIHYLHNPTTNMISDFVDNYQSTYSDFQTKYSPFVAESWVPGVLWWRDNRNDYINNIVSLYCSIKGKKKPDVLPAPFAFELCPLHSKDINGLNLSLARYRNYYRDNIFIPASEILTHSILPFGLGFASLINSVMQKRETGGYEVVAKWKNGQDIDGNIIPNWPKDNNGNPQKRTYVLIKGTDPKIGKSFFLNTWGASGRMIKITQNMMIDYKAVDEYIVNELVNKYHL